MSLLRGSLLKGPSSYQLLSKP